MTMAFSVITNLRMDLRFKLYQVGAVQVEAAVARLQHLPLLRGDNLALATSIPQQVPPVLRWEQ